MIYTWLVVSKKGVFVVHHCWHEGILSFRSQALALEYMNTIFSNV